MTTGPLQISTKIGIDSEIEGVAQFVHPEKSSLYLHLREEYKECLTGMYRDIKSIKGVLDAIMEILEKKNNLPFQSIDSNIAPPSLDATVISRLNSIIHQHNKETDEFQANVAEARKKLEETLIAESVPNLVEN